MTHEHQRAMVLLRCFVAGAMKQLDGSYLTGVVADVMKEARQLVREDDRDPVRAGD